MPSRFARFAECVRKSKRVNAVLRHARSFATLGLPLALLICSFAFLYIMLAKPSTPQYTLAALKYQDPLHGMLVTLLFSSAAMGGPVLTTSTNSVNTSTALLLVVGFLALLFCVTFVHYFWLWYSLVATFGGTAILANAVHAVFFGPDAVRRPRVLDHDKSLTEQLMRDDARDGVRDDVRDDVRDRNHAPFSLHGSDDDDDDNDAAAAARPLAFADSGDITTA